MHSHLRHIRILGCRGIPARHGGFETACERLALHFIEQGYRVTVYCQSELRGFSEDHWHGIRRVHIGVRGRGAMETIAFDWAATRHALREQGVAIVLGYGTGIFVALHRLFGMPTGINMDGLERERSKYGFLARAWLRGNEYVACRSADRVIADHPLIAAHLSRHKGVAEKLRMIPYGADPRAVEPERLRAFGLSPFSYYLAVARPEPSNQISEIIRAYAATPTRHPLVLLGDYGETSSDYAKALRASAPTGVVFPGAIYDPRVVHTLRSLCRGYIHGHRVGGTNPSLIESLVAGAPIVAHDNGFNRWVAGRGARYFDDVNSLASHLGWLDRATHPELKELGELARARFIEAFEWKEILDAYEELVAELVARLRTPALPSAEFVHPNRVTVTQPALRPLDSNLPGKGNSFDG